MKSSERWIQLPSKYNSSQPFVKATLVRMISNDEAEFQAVTSQGKIVVSILQKNNFEIAPQKDTFDDLCRMSVLNEPEVLRNLVQRFQKEQIFTFIGSTLIVLNPYKKLPNVFNDKAIDKIKEITRKGDIKELEPNIYSIAAAAFHSLMTLQTKQAIVISGESGAGKTQSTKYCTKMLSCLSSSGSVTIQERIHACNPILEAFGNSKTIRNQNSSRFGKYLRIYFDESQCITGATIESYLLEKSRVTSISKGERSFHSFYALAASAKYQTLKMSEYNVLNQSQCYTAHEIDDSSNFKEICIAFEKIGFAQNEIDRIWQTVHGVLLLGNIEFDETANKQDPNKPCVIKQPKWLEKTALQLNIDIKMLQTVLLFQRKIFVKDVMLTPFNRSGCSGNRNTLAKAIYSNLFDYLIEQMRNKLAPPHINPDRSVNILDIFGFQNFAVNSFEQLCINFTNEKLLKLYNRYVFEQEMQILTEDGLSDQIMGLAPPSNDHIIDIISGARNGMSVFSVVNDLTTLQQAKDFQIVQCLQQKMKTGNSIIGFDAMSKEKFIISHSQCNVVYSVDGFKAKNEDKLLPQLQQIVKRTPQPQSVAQNKDKTLLLKFSRQIDDLISQLNSSTVHFVRCIKPNEKKQPNMIDENFILIQTRYMGVLETIKIRKNTFPNRKTYEEFLKVYGCLVRSKGSSYKKQLNGSPQQIIKTLLTSIKCNQKEYFFGRKRVYLSQSVDDQINALVMKARMTKETQRKIRKIGYQLYFNKFIKYNLKIRFLDCCYDKINLKKTVANARIALTAIKALTKMKRQLQVQQIKQRDEERRRANEMNLQQRRKQQETLKGKGLEGIELFKKGLLRQAFSLIRSSQSNRPNFHKKQAPSLLSVQTNSKNHVQPVIVRQKYEPVLNYDENQDTSVNMDDTVLNDSIMEPSSNYQRMVSNQDKNKPKEANFNESFINDQSVIMHSKDPNKIYSQGLKVNPLKPPEPQLQGKLLELVSNKQDMRNLANKRTAFPSEGLKFSIQYCEQKLMDEIYNFPLEEFFDRVLRNRTTAFLGSKKTYKDILKVKMKPLSKSLTLIAEPSQAVAIQIFRLLLVISQGVKNREKIQLLQKLIRLCEQKPPQVLNEVLLQLVKQSNTDQERVAFTMYYTLNVFIHTFQPDRDFLLASTAVLLKRLNTGNLTKQEEQSLQCALSLLTKKLVKYPLIEYMPSLNQINCLISRLQYPLYVFLPLSFAISVPIQSYETFADIKIKVMLQFGINPKSLPPQLFGFFQLRNFSNQKIEQNPTNDECSVWDFLSQQQLRKEHYRSQKMQEPSCSIVFKIKYTVQIDTENYDLIQLAFLQVYFDYFVGRLPVNVTGIAYLSACLRLLGMGADNGSYAGRIPMRSLEDENQTLDRMHAENYERLRAKFYSKQMLKYLFLQKCSQYNESFSYIVPTLTNYELIFKPKAFYLCEEFKIIHTFPIKDIQKWTTIEKEKFQFEATALGTTKPQVFTIDTPFSDCCFDYLNGLLRLRTISQQKRKLDI